jgi:hypothetical protein
MPSGKAVRSDEFFGLRTVSLRLADEAESRIAGERAAARPRLVINMAASDLPL